MSNNPMGSHPSPQSYVTFQYIWTNHLSNNNKEYAFVGQTHQMTTTKATP